MKIEISEGDVAKAICAYLKAYGVTVPLGNIYQTGMGGYAAKIDNKAQEQNKSGISPIQDVSNGRQYNATLSDPPGLVRRQVNPYGPGRIAKNETHDD